jgi:hypothetical protein
MMTNNIDNMESIQKVILIATGLIALLYKLKNFFSIKNLKQDLKQDIEILELLKKQNNPNIENIEKKIDSDLKKIYDKEFDTDSGFFGFFIGMIFFVCFGWWTISIINNSEGFNGWIILTASMAAFGLSFVLMDTSYSRKKEPFFKIGFYEKFNMRIGFFIFLISGFIFITLLIKLNSFSFWELLAGIICIYGFFSGIYKNIKRIK